VNLRLGIDVGGTNTDAVVLDEQTNMLGSFKSPTTPDVTSGIQNAIDGLVRDYPETLMSLREHGMLPREHGARALEEFDDVADLLDDLELATAWRPGTATA
jgi:N-acetylglucosamine kinase-like BadF-type ATPase